VQAQVIDVCGAATVADIVRFTYFSTFRRLWPFILVGLLALPINLAWFAAGNVDAGINASPFSLLVLFWLAIPYASAKRQARTRPFLLEPMKYSFDADGVRVTAERFSISMTWSLVKRVRETKSAILIYEGGNLGRIVPKHFFRTEEDLTICRNFIAVCIAPRQIVRPDVIGRWC
jgi:hypothetical protein